MPHRPDRLLPPGLLLIALALCGCSSEKVTAPLPESPGSWAPTSGPSQSYVGAIHASGTTLLAAIGSLVCRSTDRGATWANVATPGRVLDFAAAGTRIFAATVFGLHRSDDDGVSWTLVDGLPQEGIYDVCVAGPSVFVTVSQHIYWSGDNGVTWAPSDAALPPSIGVGRLAAVGAAVFVGTDVGLYRSEDDGATWTLVDPSFTNFNTVTAIGTDLFVGTDNGFQRSSDRGNSWQDASAGLPPGFSHGSIVSKSATLFAASVWSVFRSDDNGNTWAATPGSAGEPLASLAVLGSDLYAGTFGGVYRSRDDGATWVTMGPADARVSALVMSGNRLLAGSSRVFRSDDAGQTWTAPRVFMGGVEGFAICGASIFAGARGGVFRSHDQGLTWELVKGDMYSTTPVTAIAATSAGPCVAIERSGVFRSGDDGAGWSPVNEGLPPDRDVRVLAAGPVGVFAGMSNTVYYLADGGNRWVARGPLPFGELNALAVNGSVVMAGLYRRGVFRSRDGGLTWAESDRGLPQNPIVNDLTIAAGVWFAALDRAGIYQSVDGGRTWSAVGGGLADPRVNALAVGGSHLFAGTTRNGVWRLPL